MVRDAVYFVERPTPASWRIGVVRTSGGSPEYTKERSGRRPALLTGEDLRPTRAYLGHLLAGRDLLPADYFRRLSETPTLD